MAAEDVRFRADEVAAAMRRSGLKKCKRCRICLFHLVYVIRPHFITVVLLLLACPARFWKLRASVLDAAGGAQRQADLGHGIVGCHSRSASTAGELIQVRHH